MPANFELIALRKRVLQDERSGGNNEPDFVADDVGVMAQLEEIALEPLLSCSNPDEVIHEDTLLVRRLQQGDMAAFEAIFRKYQTQIYRTALAITRDPGAAEEVLQDCFYKTYINIGHITGDGSLSPWLHRIAVNLSCNVLKRRRVHVEPIDEVAEAFYTSDPHHSPEAAAERAELQQKMREAINSLPLKHRVVITLHYLQDFSLPEIAYILDLPVGTVKSRLHHARKALKEQLHEPQAPSFEPVYDPGALGV
jgi:RNA polymerase sigma-70 factor (ECF subfamily)